MQQECRYNGQNGVGSDSMDVPKRLGC